MGVQSQVNLSRETPPRNEPDIIDGSSDLSCDVVAPSLRDPSSTNGEFVVSDASPQRNVGFVCIDRLVLM